MYFECLNKVKLNTLYDPNSKKRIEYFNILDTFSKREQNLLSEILANTFIDAFNSNRMQKAV